jgi:replication-associated recombination protein RarA
MTSLYTRYRPRQWSEVVGQDKALAVLDRCRQRGGLNGRAYWISGKSGTGKSTIALLIASEVADRWATTELDGGQVDSATLAELERDCRQRPMGRGCCLIVNEAHGLRAPVIRRLLVILESLPAWVTVIFTTTADGQESLFEDQIDAHPLLSRCLLLTLTSRDLAKPFAKLAKEIAQREGLDGQPIERYIKLVNEHRGNLRAVLQAIEAGAMQSTGNERPRADE